MFIVLFLSVIACVTSLLLTPMCRNLFRHFDIVDRPDRHRKFHKKPIPRAGGIPIAASYLAAFGAAIVFLPQGRGLIGRHALVLWPMLPAVALIFLIGLIDDIAGLKAKQKLLAQIVAAAWVCAAGVRITSLNGHPAAAWWAVPISIIWLVGCTNAINLIDGLDGLAAGVGMFATATTLIVALSQGNMALALVTAPLVGCLLGFLRYNFHPASVFLGDCGSLTIGFLLGGFALVWCQKSSTLPGMAAPLIALGLPLMDVGLSISRRFLSNRPILVADGRHIHHRLLALGLGPRKASLVLYTVCGATAGLSLIQGLFYKNVGAWLVVLFGVLAWFGVGALEYVEFGAARRLLVSGKLRRILQDEICLCNLRNSLKHIDSLDDYWLAIREACRDLGFHFVQLRSHSKLFEETFLEIPASQSSQFQIALPASRVLTLSRVRDDNESWPVMSFITTLQCSTNEVGISEEGTSVAVTKTYTQDAIKPIGAVLKSSRTEEIVEFS